MQSLKPDRRNAAVAHAENHADPVVREAIRALQDENAILRDVIAEDRPQALTPDRRRFIGRLLATFILVGGLIVSTAWATKSRSRAAFREGFEQGMSAGALGAPLTPPVLPTPPTPPTPPSPP